MLCPDDATEKACQILAMYEEGKILLRAAHSDPSGDLPSDGATALDNIKDACYGHATPLSDYGNAPGGCVCMKVEALEYLYNYASNFWDTNGLAVEVSALAGGSHSENSWHYEGNTVDMPCKDPIDHCEDVEAYCKSVLNDKKYQSDIIHLLRFMFLGAWITLSAAILGLAAAVTKLGSIAL